MAWLQTSSCHQAAHDSVQHVCNSNQVSQPIIEWFPLILELQATSASLRRELADHVRRHRHSLVEGLYVARLELVLLFYMP